MLWSPISWFIMKKIDSSEHNLSTFHFFTDLGTIANKWKSGQVSIRWSYNQFWHLQFDFWISNDLCFYLLPSKQTHRGHE
jgi:hypothetical protein